MVRNKFLGVLFVLILFAPNLIALVGDGTLAVPISKNTVVDDKIVSDNGVVDGTKNTRGNEKVIIYRDAFNDYYDDGSIDSSPYIKNYYDEDTQQFEPIDKTVVPCEDGYKIEKMPVKIYFKQNVLQGQPFVEIHGDTDYTDFRYTRCGNITIAIKEVVFYNETKMYGDPYGDLVIVAVDRNKITYQSSKGYFVLLEATNAGLKMHFEIDYSGYVPTNFTRFGIEMSIDIEDATFNKTEDGAKITIGNYTVFRMDKPRVNGNGFDYGDLVYENETMEVLFDSEVFSNKFVIDPYIYAEGSVEYSAVTIMGEGQEGTGLATVEFEKPMEPSDTHTTFKQFKLRDYGDIYGESADEINNTAGNTAMAINYMNTSVDDDYLMYSRQISGFMPEEDSQLAMERYRDDNGVIKAVNPSYIFSNTRATAISVEEIAVIKIKGSSGGMGGTVDDIEDHQNTFVRVGVSESVREDSTLKLNGADTFESTAAFSQTYVKFYREENGVDVSVYGTVKRPVDYTSYGTKDMYTGEYVKVLPGSRLIFERPMYSADETLTVFRDEYYTFAGSSEDRVYKWQEMRGKDEVILNYYGGELSDPGFRIRSDRSSSGFLYDSQIVKSSSFKYADVAKTVVQNLVVPNGYFSDDGIFVFVLALQKFFKNGSCAVTYYTGIHDQSFQTTIYRNNVTFWMNYKHYHVYAPFVEVGPGLVVEFKTTLQNYKVYETVEKFRYGSLNEPTHDLDMFTDEPEAVSFVEKLSEVAKVTRVEVSVTRTIDTNIVFDCGAYIVSGDGITQNANMPTGHYVDFSSGYYGFATNATQYTSPSVKPYVSYKYALSRYTSTHVINLDADFLSAGHGSLYTNNDYAIIVTGVQTFAQGINTQPDVARIPGGTFFVPSIKTYYVPTNYTVDNRSEFTPVIRVADGTKMPYIVKYNGGYTLATTIMLGRNEAWYPLFRNVFGDNTTHKIKLFFGDQILSDQYAEVYETYLDYQNGEWKFEYKKLEFYAGVWNLTEPSYIADEYGIYVAWKGYGSTEPQQFNPDRIHNITAIVYDEGTAEFIKYVEENVTLHSNPWNYDLGTTYINGTYGMHLYGNNSIPRKFAEKIDTNVITETEKAVLMNNYKTMKIRFYRDGSLENTVILNVPDNDTIIITEDGDIYSDNRSFIKYEPIINPLFDKSGDWKITVIQTYPNGIGHTFTDAYVINITGGPPKILEARLNGIYISSNTEIRIPTDYDIPITVEAYHFEENITSVDFNFETTKINSYSIFDTYEIDYYENIEKYHEETKNVTIYVANATIHENYEGNRSANITVHTQNYSFTLEFYANASAFSPTIFYTVNGLAMLGNVSIKTGEKITIDASSTIAGSGYITQIVVDWGDGSKTVGILTTKFVKTYKHSGAYKINITATNNYNKSSIEIIRVYVYSDGEKGVCIDLSMKTITIERRQYGVNVTIESIKVSEKSDGIFAVFTRDRAILTYRVKLLENVSEGQLVIKIAGNGIDYKTAGFTADLYVFIVKNETIQRATPQINEKGEMVFEIKKSDMIDGVIIFINPSMIFKIKAYLFNMETLGDIKIQYVKEEDKYEVIR